MFKSNGDDSFRAFLTACNENQDEILAGDSHYVAMMDALDSYLRKHITGPENVPDDLVVHTLRLNARYLLMTGFRIGLTGHAAGVFPTLRTALETACYAFLMSKDDSLSDVWMQRDVSPDHLKACKKAFKQPIADARDKIDQLHPNQLGSWMYALYLASIDFGAHPNSKTVTLHTRISDDEASGMKLFESLALYNIKSFEYERSLLACVETSLAVAIVLSMTQAITTDVMNRELIELNQFKNDLEEMIRAKFGDPLED
ncbi:hypothetical protein [Pseudomonas coronafaciens]|uniref:hypothetical protein n=1 Tax=Pseudomonas coronafaciens TaxID=53409 RepID=UPI0037B5CC9A